MARIKVLLARPDRADIDAAKAVLVGQGFGSVVFGDLTRHTKGQVIDQDVVVVGDADTVKRDAYAICLAVESIKDLKRVIPDEKGRPRLRDREKAVPETEAAVTRSQDQPAAATDDEGEETRGRRELFKRAREIGAQVRVGMTNEELGEAVRGREAELGPDG